MRTISATIIGLLIATALSCFVPKAEAQAVPVLCNNAREVRQFFLGVAAGRNLGQQAIAAVERDSSEDDICQDLEAIEALQELVQDIVDALNVPDAPSDLVLCRVQGQVAGLVQEITDLQGTCEDACIADGEFIGNISALLYCELSKALDGLGLADLFERLATTTCGGAFQDACDAEFFEVAVADPECVEFTVDPFVEVFATAQNNQCAANPDVP